MELPLAEIGRTAKDLRLRITESSVLDMLSVKYLGTSQRR